MPVPRRYDRRPPERDQTRINDRIRVPEVRLVGDDGKQIGVVKTSEALLYAQERDLDLVEVAPEARPPVCRVLDYSKFKYEQAQKQKAARKHQQQITIREIKFRPKIAQNDYDTKKGHVERFLKGKDKVKVTIMFRGREVTHPERGVALLNKLAGELAELAVVEQNPLQDGRNMTMMLAPSKAVLALDEHEEHPVDEESHGGKRQHKHEENLAAHEAKVAAAGDEPTEDPVDESSDPAPITEIEVLTDVEETPKGLPAQKAKKPKSSKPAADTAAEAADVVDAVQAVEAEPPVEEPELESDEPAPITEIEPVSAAKPTAKATKAAAPKPKPKAGQGGTSNGSARAANGSGRKSPAKAAAERD